MNELFALADYGTQYRTLSHTGAILGSIKNNGQILNTEKQKKIPNWLKDRIKKV